MVRSLVVKGSRYIVFVVSNVVAIKQKIRILTVEVEAKTVRVILKFNEIIIQIMAGNK